MGNPAFLKIHQFAVEEAFESLHSSVGGLTTVEAERRLLEYGPNSVKRVSREPLFVRFLKEFVHFFALILWAAVGLSFFAEWKDPGSGMDAMGWAIAGVIFINAFFSFFQTYRAEKAIAALEKLLPHQVEVFRDGTLRTLLADMLVPGDLIFLEDGNLIPADCRVVEAFGARVNNATITGESVPNSRNAETSQTSEPILSKNLLWAGTTLMSGRVKALVFATGSSTEFGKIAQLTQSSGWTLSPLQREVVYASRLIAFFSILLGVLFFFIGRAMGLALWQNLLFVVGIIVANVPEGMLPTMTLALARTAQRMARRNALVRRLPAVEALGSATVICTDKTGTLTQNRMEASYIFLPRGLNMLGEGINLAALGRESPVFFEIMFHCQDLKTRGLPPHEEVLGDPMEMALYSLAKKALPVMSDRLRLDEIPFESDRRRLSTLYESPQGSRLYTKGALEALLPLCDRIWEGDEKPLTADWKDRFLEIQNDLAGKGYRVLAFAYRDLPKVCEREHWEEKLVLTGLAALADPFRPEVPEAIAKCHKAGIKVIMVTGDHALTAQAIASQIGLSPSGKPLLLTGEVLRLMNDAQLQLALDAPDIIFARINADQKMRVVEALRAKGEVVAVTGDGVNDAPALKKADIGIAMGLTGTDVARETADIILTDDNFASIVNAVEEGRAVFANIRKFLTYFLTSNVPELVPYLVFVLLRVPLALPVIQVLAVDLGTDMFPGLALGAEKPAPDVMDQPPRPRKNHLLDGGMIARVYLLLGLIEALGSMTVFFWILKEGGWRWGVSLGANDPLYMKATTACLGAIVIAQVFNVFQCRHEKTSFFRYGLAGNRLLLWGVGAECLIIALIVYTPWGNHFFWTAPLAPGDWLKMIPFGFALLFLEEGRKFFARKVWGFYDRRHAPNQGKAGK